MGKSKTFKPKTIEALHLKDVAGGGIDRPIFIGYKDPIDNIKF
ncbi:hypothetical protein PRUB_a0198 [Pseudoalteromonas rubra]|uniref:Uncharacterized protein n=1 Tax=Pseudoalteromonas rubra TaxID=43658 RepID=A0A8T0C551_9GAMM|nr:MULTISPECIES: hypothetical protein [Pseudoalteromonas]KAF7785809.1 hypothetical protein PRUB_a0198 [Pseudoalteromonas rubra]MDK1310772.1 hypothetical protein [Pseudoalteromonas sp. R96]